MKYFKKKEKPVKLVNNLDLKFDPPFKRALKDTEFSNKSLIVRDDVQDVKLRIDYWRISELSTKTFDV